MDAYARFTALERIGTSSLTVAVTLARPDGAVALEGRVVLVAWDPAARRSRPLTEVERERLSHDLSNDRA